MSFEAVQYAWWKSRVAGTDRCILAAMAEYCDEKGECYGSAGHLSDKTGFSRRTVQRALANLQEAGEIVQRDKGGFDADGRPVANGWVLPNVPHLSRAPLRQIDVSLTSNCRKPLRQDDALVIHTEHKETESPQAAPVAVAAAAEPQQEKQNPSPPLSSEKAKRKSAFDPTLIPLPHGPRFRHAWGEWVQHRKEKRSPLTPLAASKQLKDLAALSEDDAMDCVCKSIKNGWTGLFADNYGSKGKPSVRPSNVIPVRKSAGFDEEMAEFRALARA
jgi:hypothetical protein